MIRKFTAIAVTALAFSLAGCGGTDTATPPKGDSIANVAAPAGKAWTSMVAKTEQGFKMGNPDAALQLVEYGAITCPGCAQFSVESTEELDAMIDSGVVAFEFRPYLVHGIQDVPGFLLAQCNGADAFFGLKQQLYARQQEWLGRLQGLSESEQQSVGTMQPADVIKFLGDKMGLVEFVKPLGISEDAAKICLADQKAFDALVKDSERASKEDKVSATPTLLLNGAPLNAGDWKTVKIALKNAGAR